MHMQAESGSQPCKDSHMQELLSCNHTTHSEWQWIWVKVEEEEEM